MGAIPVWLMAKGSRLDLRVPPRAFVIVPVRGTRSRQSANSTRSEGRALRGLSTDPSGQCQSPHSRRVVSRRVIPLKSRRRRLTGVRGAAIAQSEPPLMNRTVLKRLIFGWVFLWKISLIVFTGFMQLLSWRPVISPVTIRHPHSSPISFQEAVCIVRKYMRTPIADLNAFAAG